MSDIMKKFEIGDRVVATDDIDFKKMRGEYGTVLGSRSEVVLIRWDNDIGGHTCDGLCEDGHGWNAGRRDFCCLELVEEEAVCCFDNIEILEIIESGC